MLIAVWEKKFYCVISCNFRHTLFPCTPTGGLHRSRWTRDHQGLQPPRTYSDSAKLNPPKWANLSAVRTVHEPRILACIVKISMRYRLRQVAFYFSTYAGALWSSRGGSGPHLIKPSFGRHESPPPKKKSTRPSNWRNVTSVTTSAPVEADREGRSAENYNN